MTQQWSKSCRQRWCDLLQSAGLTVEGTLQEWSMKDTRAPKNTHLAPAHKHALQLSSSPPCYCLLVAVVLFSCHCLTCQALPKYVFCLPVALCTQTPPSNYPKRSRQKTGLINLRRFWQWNVSQGDSVPFLLRFLHFILMYHFFLFLLMLRCASHNSAHSYRSALFYRNVSQEGDSVSKRGRLVMTELASSPLCVFVHACVWMWGLRGWDACVCSRIPGLAICCFSALCRGTMLQWGEHSN